MYVINCTGDTFNYCCFTANTCQPWMDSRDYYSEYLIIHFDYFIFLLDYLIIHSPHEITSTMGKTTQDAQRKQIPCRKVFINISNKSASNKLKNVSIESSELLCLNRISFCSISCKLKTFLLSIASVLTLIVNGPRP